MSGAGGRRGGAERSGAASTRARPLASGRDSGSTAADAGRPDRGFALATTVLLLLALGSLGGGALFLARRELEIAEAAGALVQERAAAEGALRRALQKLQKDTLPALAPWRSARLLEGSAGRVDWRVDVLGLSEELVLLRGSATRAGGVAPRPGAPPAPPREDALVAWALAPAARVGAALAAVEAGGAVAAASAVDGSTVADPPEGWPASACEAWRAALDSLFRARSIRPVVPLADTSGLAFPSLGMLDRTDLVGRIARRASGTVTPEPVVAWGRCVDEAAHNWGSPGDPRGPCGSHRPSVASEGDLTLRGGEGQGVLLVLGDLVLTDGARYAGLLLVGGNLTVERGARLDGLARVGGAVHLDGGRVVASGCPVLLALASASDLRAPRPVRGGAWVAP